MILDSGLLFGPPCIYIVKRHSCYKVIGKVVKSGLEFIKRAERESKRETLKKPLQPSHVRTP